jgi:tRNA pseudouridine55 synthase
MSKGNRARTDLSGVLAIDKPQGISSHDVVNQIRRATGERRVGHCGTLDPLATGLLLVCVGPATRLSDYLMSNSKAYLAQIDFGIATTTDDRLGAELYRRDVPPAVRDEARVNAYLQSMVGKQQQQPPSYSAIKVGGVKGYQAARKGDDLKLPSRGIEVYDARLVNLGNDSWDVYFSVSKGTYIRSLARDAGIAFDSAACLGELRRVASGSINVESAQELDTLEDAEKVRAAFIDPAAALGLPIAVVDDRQLQDVGNGRPLCLQPGSLQTTAGPGMGGAGSTAGDGDGQGVQFVSVVNGRRLAAIYGRQGAGNIYKPQVVIPGGVEGVC